MKTRTVILAAAAVAFGARAFSSPQAAPQDSIRDAAKPLETKPFMIKR